MSEQQPSRSAANRFAEFHEVSRRLLQLSNRGTLRVEFLRQATAVLLSFTQADALDLWLEEADLRYLWQATARPEPSLGFTRLDASDPAQWPVPDPGDTPSVATIPFEIDETNRGVLRLRSATPGLFDDAHVVLCQGVGQVLGVAIANRRAHAALTERVKELSCMYSMARIAEEPHLELEDVLQRVAERLPPAWQYPDHTVARIELDGRSFLSPRYEQGRYSLSADIRIGGDRRGQVVVSYTPQGPHADEIDLLGDSPFLVEERGLIEGVARELTFIIEQREAAHDRARLREQLLHADRLATIGQLTAGIAHELNEPLANILGFAQLAAKTPGTAGQTRQDLGRIVDAALHARDIIKSLMLFSRQTPPRRAETQLGDVVDQSLALFEARLSKLGIHLERQLDPELTPIRADPGQLQQVVVNLLVNAMHAMPEGGVLRVVTAADESADSVCLIVEDTGGGMPPETVERAFLPFFTTKDVGEGTGLGLAVVHGIVTAHGGSIEVDSAVGRGARFVIRLPAHLRDSVEGDDDA